MNVGALVLTAIVAFVVGVMVGLGIATWIVIYFADHPGLQV